MRRGRAVAGGSLLAALALVGCAGPEPGVRLFTGEPWPDRLSEWRLFTGEPGELVSSAGVLPYDLNTPLFSDYALKYRTVWMPGGRAAPYREGEVLALPVGTILSKTFYYPRDPEDPERVRILRDERLAVASDRASGADRPPGSAGERLLIETRLLVHTENGWVALPYVWDSEQREARLEIAGDQRSLSWRDGAGRDGQLDYLVPNADQCASCHVHQDGFLRELRPLGPTVRNLNRAYAYATGRRNQLTRWSEAGYLEGAPPPRGAPRLPVWNDPDSGDVRSRARAYLEVQCAHCHAPGRPADGSGLLLGVDEPDPTRLGICKTPVAAGRGAGDLRYSVVPGRPEESILLFRMISREPDVMMPELGRDLRHDEGVELVRRWIAGLEGRCDADPAVS